MLKTIQCTYILYKYGRFSLFKNHMCNWPAFNFFNGIELFSMVFLLNLIGNRNPIFFFQMAIKHKQLSSFETKINDPIYLNKINGIRVFCIVTYIIKLDAFFSFACVRDQHINVWIALLYKNRRRWTIFKFFVYWIFVWNIL